MRPFFPSLTFSLSSTLGVALILGMLSACDSEPVPTPKAAVPVAPVSNEVTLIEGCNSCHGRNGVSRDPAVPFIAGQHVKYLEGALREYLIGDRRHEVMRAAVFDLEASDRHQLAEHFSKLDTPWKQTAAQRQQNSGGDNARDIRAGQSLARPCAGCHGTDGNSIKSGVPSLAGLQPEYFIPALKSYLQGKRHGAAIMKNFKLSLSERDIKQLAAFFAAQKRLRSPLGAKLNPANASDALAHRCLGCHGDDGNSTHPAIPTLAGQNADYLAKAMRTYRDKERQNEMMSSVAKGLSDESIERNAIYFATRTPVTLMTSKPAKIGKVAFDPLGQGKRLAASCNGCHGPNGNSKIPGTPRLAGQQEAYLQTAIRHYRDGQRQHGMMQMLTRYLSDTDIEKVALFYASQTPDSVKSTTSNTSAGEKLASGCAGCHGEDGNSKTATTPSLAGQNADYIVAALHAYKNDKRHNDDMKGAAQELDNKAMKSVARYYSQLAPKNAPVHKMEAPATLAKKCNRCHGANGNKPDADKPRLAGQRQAYLINAINDYKNKKRINSMMYSMTAELSRVEIEAIAAYYAGMSGK